MATPPAAVVARRRASARDAACGTVEQMRAAPLVALIATGCNAVLGLEPVALDDAAVAADATVDTAADAALDRDGDGVPDADLVVYDRSP